MKQAKGSLGKESGVTSEKKKGGKKEHYAVTPATNQPKGVLVPSTKVQFAKCKVNQLVP